MNRTRVISLTVAAALAGASFVFAQQTTAPVKSPEVGADQRVTFRLRAPKATEAGRPCLNDSYILGGAHGGHEFHLALEDVAVVPTTKTLAQIFASLPESEPKAKWQSFFNGQPGIFWDQKLNAPRVLVRELIGLKACGYRARFQPQQLSFVPTRIDSSTTFATYLNSLGAQGHSNKNRPTIFNALSLFLFQKSGMLRES